MRSGLVLAAVCLGWGTIPFVADEIALPAGAIVFARVWIAAAGLGVIVAAARPPGPALFSVSPRRVVAVGVLLALHWTAMFAAYERAPASVVIFLIFLAPLGIAVIERPGARLVGALAVALAGFVLIAGPTLDASDDREVAGVGLAAIAGVLFVALVLLAKPVAETYGGLRTTLMEMVVAGLTLVPLAAATAWDGAGHAIGWLLLLGLVHTAIGTAIYLRTLAALPATEVGILGYLEPVGVVLFGWVLIGDQPTLATMIGAALVVAGAALALVTTPTPSREVSARVPR